MNIKFFQLKLNLKKNLKLHGFLRGVFSFISYFAEEGNTKSIGIVHKNSVENLYEKRRPGTGGAAMYHSRFRFLRRMRSVRK